MTSTRNGMMTKWALALLAAGALGLAGWGGKTIIADGARLTSLETMHLEFGGRLERMERKLDRLIERR